MATKRKIPTKTLYIYSTPAAYAFARAQAKKSKTPGGVSGWVTNLITLRMQKKKSLKKEVKRAGDSK